ncbi:MAG: hypothetical protein AB1768_14840 [Pseudomonadota bacterium]
MSRAALAAEELRARANVRLGKTQRLAALEDPILNRFPSRKLCVFAPLR